MADIKNNFKIEKEIIEQLKILIDERKKTPEHAEFYSNVIFAILDKLDALNKSIPDMLEKKVSIVRGLLVSRKEKEKLVKSLDIEEDLLKSIKRIRKIEAEKENKISFFSIIAGKMFSNIAFKIRDNKIFLKLNEDLRKSNSTLLLTNYISTMILSVFISLIISLASLFFFILQNQIGFGVISLFFPFVIFFFLYFFPSSQASSIKSKVEDELPFAIIHMSAISGSGVTPLQIFEIIAKSSEYPAVGSEMRKIVNQINLYGYSLVNSLRSIAKKTASPRLSDLLNGIATTIASGGDLSDYLDKNASDTLNDYKLRRKRYLTISETYADIYTGLLIAAPLIFMLILVLVNVIGGGIAGMSPETLAMLGIGALVVVNIAFVVFLEISQPKG